MKKLEPENQIAVTKETLQHVLDAYSISDFTFKPITQGIANTALFVSAGNKEYVLRIYVQGKDLAHVLCELQFQDLLRDHGIPVPVVYAASNGERVTVVEKDGKRWQAILMEKIHGKSVTKHPSHALIKELATLQARMHLLGVEFAEKIGRPAVLWKELRDTLAEKVTDVPPENREVVALIERVKMYRYQLSPDLPYGYNHLDIDFDGNTITKGDKVVGILDFDDLQYSPIVVCLGYTLWDILKSEGDSAMRYYLREYENVRPLELVERETLPHVLLFRNHVIAVLEVLLREEGEPVPDLSSFFMLESEIPKLVL